MRTYNVDYTPDTSLSVIGKISDYLVNKIAPIFDAFNNLTYIGLATQASKVEIVFQIKEYTNLYLALAKPANRGDFAYDGSDFFIPRLRTTTDLTTAGTYFTDNIAYGGTTSCNVVSNQEFIQNFYMIVDENNNLRYLWQPKSPIQPVTASQGILLSENENGRDIIGIFGSDNNPIYVIYLDDENRTVYRIPRDGTFYGNEFNVIKKNWYPITTSNNINSTVDNLSNRTVRIFNTSLGAYENDNNNFNSSHVRKLIQIGTKKYRQIVSSYWIEDPLGDETPIIVS